MKTKKKKRKPIWNKIKKVVISPKEIFYNAINNNTKL